MNLENFLTKEQKKKINQAVVKAEKKTNAEIVPVITDSSGQYDRAEDLLGLLLAIASVCTIWLYKQKATISEWGQTEYKYSLLLIIITILVSFVLGVFIASRVWFLRHLFTPRSEMKKCVKRGAQRAFHEFQISKTSNDNGIMIYVSLFERMVYILGDKNIRKKFSEDDFSNICEVITQNLRQGKPCEALCEGIDKCGGKLKEHFASGRSKKNQLENHLRIFEQNL